MIKNNPYHKLNRKHQLFQKFKHQPVSSISKPKYIDLQPLGITINKKLPRQLVPQKKSFKRAIVMKKSVTPSIEIQYSSLLTHKLNKTNHFPKIKKNHQKPNYDHMRQQLNTLKIDRSKKDTCFSQEDQYDKKAIPGPGSYIKINHSLQRQNNFPHNNFSSKVRRFSQNNKGSPDKSNMPIFPLVFTKSFKQEKQNLRDIGYGDMIQCMKNNVIRKVIKNLQIERYNSPQQRKQRNTLQHQPKPTRQQIFNILHNANEHSYFTTIESLQGW